MRRLVSFNIFCWSHLILFVLFTGTQSVETEKLSDHFEEPLDKHRLITKGENSNTEPDSTISSKSLDTEFQKSIGDGSWKGRDKVKSFSLNERERHPDRKRRSVEFSDTSYVKLYNEIFPHHPDQGENSSEMLLNISPQFNEQTTEKDSDGLVIFPFYVKRQEGTRSLWKPKIDSNSPMIDVYPKDSKQGVDNLRNSLSALPKWEDFALSRGGRIVQSLTEIRPYSSITWNMDRRPDAEQLLPSNLERITKKDVKRSQFDVLMEKLSQLAGQKDNKGRAMPMRFGPGKR